MHIFYGLEFYRSVFGGTVGPNPMKPVNSNEPQYYEGIKLRAQPLVISIQPASTPVQQAKGVKRKAQTVNIAPAPSTALTVIADNSEVPPVSPASPILKAQLSAPPKQRESNAASVPVSKSGSSGDLKSQV